MTTVVTSAPANELLTTAEAKAWLRVDFASDDTIIDSLAKSGRVYLENFTRRAFVTQTVRHEFDCWPASGVIRLPRPPLQSVTSVKYYNSAGVLTTLNHRCLHR